MYFVITKLLFGLSAVHLVVLLFYRSMLSGYSSLVDFVVTAKASCYQTLIAKPTKSCEAHRLAIGIQGKRVVTEVWSDKLLLQQSPNCNRIGPYHEHSGQFDVWVSKGDVCR